MTGSGSSVFSPGEPRVTGSDRHLLCRLLDSLGKPPVRVALWSGEVVCDSPDAVATVRIRDRRTLWGLLVNPNLVFGDAYAAGRIEVDGDLLTCLEAIFEVMPLQTDSAWYTRLIHRVAHHRANTLTGSRANIHQHYDIGNDFYRLWLDDELAYTCAYYTSPDETLENAQLEKMRHVCRKLQLKPGERVVEAGCGWGALARYMARHYGVKVRAYNISEQQIRYARERAKAEGLEDSVEYIEDDYRNITGHYDAFVSIGMLEHVGSENYQTLGRVVDGCLTRNGRGLIHSVGRSRPEPMGDWIENRIFPGSYVPALSEMLQVVEPWGFSVLDVENLRLHYALTLRHWLERFDAARDQISGMYDDRFIRAWRLYLAGCSASFATGWLQLFQVLFAHPRNNNLPWTRAHLYMT